MAKNILITGANGQLGNELKRIQDLNLQFSTFFTDVDNLDITNFDAIDNFILTNKIEIIINCAAFTNVDLAEDNEEICRKINTEAVENLAKAALKHNAKIVHISTDYVFDGHKNSPYIETDTTNPQSIYGATKAEGERLLQAILPNDSIIIRTAWLYSAFGKNFVKTMLSLGRTKDTLNVVNDQTGTPTHAKDLANAIYTIISHKSWTPGIYHYSNEGICTWYDFTRKIHQLAGITSCKVQPITTAEYPVKAKRPKYSVLDKTKIKDTFNLTIPKWEDSLEICINELENNI